MLSIFPTANAGDDCREVREKHWTVCVMWKPVPLPPQDLNFVGTFSTFQVNVGK
jgi:hypothetical protein